MTEFEVDVFYFSVCHVCKSCKESIKRCSGCRLLSYCGKEHQRIDWDRHKDLCLCVQDILKKTGKENIFCAVKELTSIKDWSELRTKAMRLTESILNRPLRVEERQMFLFPNTCRVCFKTVAITCSGCLSIGYCSESHQRLDRQNHQECCKKLKLCFNLDMHMLQPSFKYPVISSLFNEEKNHLTSNINSFICSFVPKNGSEYSLYLMSESLTCVTTLMYSLEVISLTPSDGLTVHVVGAGQLEYSLIETVDVFLHWFLDLSSLNIVFIGPECPDYPSDALLCDECSKNKKVNIKLWKGFYHDYVEKYSAHSPDVIISYNCGLHEFMGEPTDTWGESVTRFLDSPGSYLVLTSYNKVEAEKDLNRVLSHDVSSARVEIVKNCQENPFRSLRPYRDWEHDTVGIFFQNNYLSIVKIL